MKYRRAFTLIEALVALAVIAVIAGFLMPVIMGYIEGARIVRANKYVEVIGRAILSFNKDTARWPVYQDSGDAEPSYSILYGPGALPAENVASGDRLKNQLNSNIPNYPATGEFAWRGPYLSSLNSDAWGNACVVYASGLSPSSTKAVWVVSAGSNGIIDTPFDQETDVAALLGDDIGYRIK